MSTAITASVWGQGRAAVALSAQVAQQGLKEGDEECHICRDDIPATIAFVPCKHKVCFGCVENMRAKNIFKADKGIKCPFCRQYVDGYRSIMAPSAAVQKFLLEANKAANIAAQARAVAERKAMGLPGAAAAAPGAAAVGAGSSSSSGAASGGSRPVSAGSASAAAAAAGSPGEDQQWNCGSCGTGNYEWREFCAKCKRPCAKPYGSDPLSQTRKDLSVASRDEVVGYLKEQGAFAVRRALKDMGVTVDSWRSYGSPQSVREATALYGLKKRVLRVMDLLSDPAALRDASLTPLGNLGVQRVMEAAAKLRVAFPPERPNKDLEEWKAKHGGKDPFSVLLSALLSHLLEFCLNDKGVYVAQCAAALANNTELIALANAVFPIALPVVRDPRGVFVLLSVLDLISQKIWDDPVNREPGLQAVDLLCTQFLVSEKQLGYTAQHALSGKVLVRAVAVSMPRQPALRLAVKIAAMASPLAAATNSGGLATLTELLQLYGHNQQAAEGLRDVVTTMCYSLQGQINRFAVTHDEAANDFLLFLVERLGHEQEQGWLDSIAQELVGCVDALVDNPNGLELLKFTLSQPCLDLDSVSMHISDMKTVLGKKALLPIVADIMERVASNPPAAPPKYPAASVIQPELRYYLQQGWPTPLPPPPPPKPGEPGYEEYAEQAAARKEAQAQAAAAARAEKEAAAKARRDAAAAAAAEAAAANSSSSASTAAQDAWGVARAAGSGGSSSAWEVSSPAAASNSGEQSSSTAAAAAAADDDDVSNPWGSVMHNAQSSNAIRADSPWATASWGTGSEGDQQQQQADAGSAPAAAAAATLPVSVPVAVPLAIPVAVPVEQTSTAAAAAAAVSQQPAPFSVPVSIPVATPVPAAAAAVSQQPTPFSVPVSVPVATPVPAAAAAVQPPAPTPVPQQYTAQPRSTNLHSSSVPGMSSGHSASSGSGFGSRSSGNIAVANFSAAAPALFQPGSTPPSQPVAVLGSSSPSSWPAPQQVSQMVQQQQRQQQQGYSNSSSQFGQQQQQQQRQGSGLVQQQQQQQPLKAWSCSVCTYEHAGAEAEFLFCAMCSTQKPA